MGKLRGFAFLVTFYWLSLLLPLVASASTAVVDATFWEEKLSTLVFRQAIGWDVRHAFSRVLASVRGETVEEKTADLASKLAAFEAFVEKEYTVPADVWFGPAWSVKPLLKAMLQEQKPLRCAPCRDFSHPLRLLSGIYGVSFYGGDWSAVEVLS